MPELLEIEMYRRALPPLAGHRIERVRTPDVDWIRGSSGAAFRRRFGGAMVEEVDRIGKVLILSTSAGDIALRFGMTGRLVVNDVPVISRLEYSTPRLDRSWVRFSMAFSTGDRVDVNDPRRLGSASVDPDLAALGPDAWSVTETELAAVLAGSRAALKSVLLDQRRIAGIGNLLGDELLWRAGVHPGRPANQIAAAEVTRLAALLPVMLDELMGRGGSTEGDHQEARHTDGHCPRDGAPMRRTTIGGRTTWYCPEHQR